MIEALQAVEWADGVRPECPQKGCGQPTTGLRERRGSVTSPTGRVQGVILVVAVPCGHDVTDVAQVMMSHHPMRDVP